MEIKKYKGNIIGVIGYSKIEGIKDFEVISFKDTVIDRMIYEIERRNLEVKDYKKKIKDSLKIVGLDIELERSINTLSYSEKKLLQIAIELLENPDTLIFIEPFRGLDLFNIKKLMRLFRKLIDKYNKTIIFISDNSDILYKNTDYILVYKNNKLIKQGETKKVFEDVEFLKKNKINIPEIVDFTYLVKTKYNVKIDYHRDIRDIIKDIYKHV